MGYFDKAYKGIFSISPDDDYVEVDGSLIDSTIDEVLSLGATDEYTLTKDEADEIDLSSFRPQKTLNTKIWEGEKLNPLVRMRLLDIAGDFIEYLGIRNLNPIDIILTGSLANYNWSNFSDFDLHVVVDFNDIDKRTDFVSEFFNTKKNEWNNKHDDLKIFGYPVELYVQDANEVHNATGIYSLLDDSWLVMPEKDNIKAIQLNKYFIKEKSLKFIKAINKLKIAIESETDNDTLSALGEKVKSLFDKIKGIRREGLLSSGEMSSGNIIYKVLRRMGWIEVLLDLKYDVYDKIKSIES